MAMSIEDAVAILNERIQKLEEKMEEEDKPESYRDLTLWDTTIGDLDRYIIEPMKGKPKQQPSMVMDDLFGVWHDPLTARFHMYVDNVRGPPDRYEWVRGFYWLPLILEPIEEFFDFPRREAADAVVDYKKRLAEIEKDYNIEKIDIVTKLGGAAKATGSPGNSPEEAQHYANTHMAEELYNKVQENRDMVKDIIKLGVANYHSEGLGAGFYKTAKVEG
ncbi:MAG: hypothetical protein ACE5J7_00105 [Candidatus Aenigmatarchaeota archaeon]